MHYYMPTWCPMIRSNSVQFKHIYHQSTTAALRPLYCKIKTPPKNSSSFTVCLHNCSFILSWLLLMHAVSKRKKRDRKATEECQRLRNCLQRKVNWLTANRLAISSCYKQCQVGRCDYHNDQLNTMNFIWPSISESRSVSHSMIYDMSSPCIISYDTCDHI